MTAPSGGDPMEQAVTDIPAMRERAPTWEQVTLVINGQDATALVPADQRLATFLREERDLTGTKIGCEVGVCGACTVLVDGKPVSSCITLTVQVDGAEITTIEGVAQRPDLRRLLDSFISEGGYQCGYCTSGQIVTAAWLVLNEERTSRMDAEQRRECMQGNLCRCTGYYGIQRALDKALE